MLKRTKSAPDRPYCAAVIVAAGSSTRMGEDKMLMELHGRPVIEHTLRAFEKSPYIDEIVVVTQGDKIPAIANIARDAGIRKLKCVTEGGADRCASSWAGVQECSQHSGIIAIHDAARPLVTGDIIERAVTAARERGAASPGHTCEGHGASGARRTCAADAGARRALPDADAAGVPGRFDTLGARGGVAAALWR